MARRLTALPLAALTATALAACSDPSPPAAPSGVTFGGPAASVAFDEVAVDSTGAAVVGGAFVGTIEHDGLTPMVSTEQADGVIARFERDGTLAWARSFAGTGIVGRNDYVTGLAVMADDSVVVTGFAEGAVDLGGGPIGGPPDNPYAMFIARFASDGTHLWSQRWPARSNESMAARPTIGPDGSIYVAAHFSFGATIGATTLAVDDEVVVVRLTAAGQVVWARPLRPQPVPPFAGSYAAGSIVIDGDSLLIGGASYGPVDFGTGPLAASEEYRAFVVRLALADGALREVRAYLPADAPYGHQTLARAPDGTLRLGNTQVAALGSDLAIRWAVDLGDLAPDPGLGGEIAVRADGTVVWISATHHVRVSAAGVAGERIAIPDSARLGGVAVGGDDQEVVVGSLTGTLTLGEQTFTVPPDDHVADGFVAWIR